MAFLDRTARGLLLVELVRGLGCDIDGLPHMGLAEARVLPAFPVVKLPASIDFETGAAMMLKGLTVQYLLRRTRVGPFHADAGARHDCRPRVCLAGTRRPDPFASGEPRGARVLSRLLVTLVSSPARRAGPQSRDV